jgi:archaellum component FlaC
MAETLDTLGEKIAGLATRLDGIDKRFDSVDKRFDGVDKRFDGIDQRFDGVDKRFDGIDKRFDGVDKGFKGLNQRIDDVRSELKTQIEAVDAKVGLVLEKVEGLIARDVRHSAVHVGFELQLENHDLRLTALEAGRKPAGPAPESS